jgi:uncharacterized protein YacL
MLEIFADISKFSRISDYLPILNGAILAEILIIAALFYTNIFKSSQLERWYTRYGLSAVIADVLILVIGIIIARALYSRIFGEKFNIIWFVLLVLGIQIIHDVLFYFLFAAVPVGTNKMLDLFKDYAKEVKGGAILGDSIMIAIATLAASLFAGGSLNTNIIALVGLTYVLPYILHTK